MLKCHGCHGDFHGSPNSFGNHVTNIEIFSSPAALNCRKIPKNLGMSRQLWGVAETKISAEPSRVTGPAELIEMVQYVLDVGPAFYSESADKETYNPPSSFLLREAETSEREMRRMSPKFLPLQSLRLDTGAGPYGLPLGLPVGIPVEILTCRSRLPVATGP